MKEFEAFLNDDEGWDMYITGRAGTGKTTLMSKLSQICDDRGLDITVCAFTHKACGILRSKLPKKANVKTLHSFLRKRPTVNQLATHEKNITLNAKFEETEETSILFIDEYSMVGEKDLADIRAEQGETADGKPTMKVVWLGDPNQLPPVGDVQAVSPDGDYNITLTKVYRQASYNPLLDTLDDIISFIQGKPIHALECHDAFHRNEDIVDLYGADQKDKILLAFTNKRVQELNEECEGKPGPTPGDRVFSPTTKEYYTFKGWADGYDLQTLDIPFGEPLVRDMKYKSLERLIKNHDMFAIMTSEGGEDVVMAVEFGHYEHKVNLEVLKKAAAASNKAIVKFGKTDNAAMWAKKNHSHKLSRVRGQAWSSFLAYNSFVICLDFTHAMTVHKSQGSTYRNVYLDIQDLGIAAEINLPMYLKLMYVAMSRASNMVITN
jgi:exodeoxyribonuclease-5